MNFFFHLVLDSPTDYLDDREGISCDYTNSSDDIKVPQTLPLSVEQVKLDSLTSTSSISQPDDQGNYCPEFSMVFVSKVVKPSTSCFC